MTDYAHTLPMIGLDNRYPRHIKLMNVSGDTFVSKQEDCS